MPTTKEPTLSLAEQLHRLANQKQAKNIEMMANQIVLLATAHAKETANKGSYTCSFYDERLGEVSVANQVKTRLEIDGFKVKVNEDQSYSRSVEKRMWRVEISW